jgi:signal transduction histidine kinase
LVHYNRGMAECLPEPEPEARLPRLLSLASHELRSPLSAVAGYIRMLLQERAGPISDGQRRLLQEAEKSCRRLSSLLAELSDVARLEAGAAPFNASTVELSGVLEDAVRAIPAAPDRDLTISLPDGPVGSVHGDAARLASAFAAIFHALLRELVSGPGLAVRARPAAPGGTSNIHITIADPASVDDLAALDSSRLASFDEWRGGTGLALPRARRIIDAHRGRLLGPPESKAAAVVILPSASP